MAVYHKNNIPCVYLWPDNLGALDWILKRRITETLLKYNKNLLLIKQQWNDYTEKNGIGILIFIGLTVYNWKSKWKYLFISLLLINFLFECVKRIKKLKKLKKSKWVSSNKG